MSAVPMTYPVASTRYGNALAAVPGVIRPSQIVNVGPWMWQAGFGAGWAWLLAQLPAAWHIHWAFTAVPLGFLAFRAFWIGLETRCLNYSFDGERISWMAGVLSRTSGSIEAHRIQTVYMDQTLIERVVDVGSVTLKTQDDTDHPSSTVKRVSC